MLLGGCSRYSYPGGFAGYWVGVSTCFSVEKVTVVPDSSRGGAKLAQLREHRRQKRVASPSPTSASVESMEDRMGNLVKSYMDYCRSSMQPIKAQYQRMGKETDQVDWKKVKDDEILYISSKFDSLEWWKTQGAREFAVVFRVALPSTA